MTDAVAGECAGGVRRHRTGQPPDFEPLVVVCDGVGLGAGGLGGGVTVVGFGVGLAEVDPGAGVGWEPGELPDPFGPDDCPAPGETDEPGFFAPWWRCALFVERLADALALGLAPGVVAGWPDEVVVVDAAT